MVDGVWWSLVVDEDEFFAAHAYTGSTLVLLLLPPLCKFPFPHVSLWFPPFFSFHRFFLGVGYVQ